MEDMTKTDMEDGRDLGQPPALLGRLRVAGAVELFAALRAWDGGELRERCGPAGRCRGALWSLSGEGRQRLVPVVSPLGRSPQVIFGALGQGQGQGLGLAKRRTGRAAERQLRGEGGMVTQAVGMKA